MVCKLCLPAFYYLVKVLPKLCLFFLFTLLYVLFRQYSLELPRLAVNSGFTWLYLPSIKLQVKTATSGQQTGLIFLIVIFLYGHLEDSYT